MIFKLGAEGNIPKSIAKTSFRVSQTNDGRTLIDHPQRVNKQGNEPTQVLVIDDESVTVQERKQAFPSSPNAITSTQDIMGLLGYVELAFGRYIVAVTSRSLAATIQAHKIWRITSAALIPVGSTRWPKEDINSLEEDLLAELATDLELLEHVKTIVNSGHMYYSTSYDLTHSLQHNHLRSSSKAPSATIDDRYFFNRHLQSAFLNLKDEAEPWIIRAVCGFAGAIDIDYRVPGSDKTRTYTSVLVSRLNHRRLGTRYFCRGLDKDGNAANNVEMEQIVFHHDFLKDKTISSYVQIRGSVPSIWGQELDLSYRPRLVLSDTSSDAVKKASETHLRDLKLQYINEKSIGGIDSGSVVCVNLLDDSGFEGPLSSIYEKAVSDLSDPKVQYESFPVNKWCKKMNYRNMDILLDRVHLRLINSGIFVAEGEVPSLKGPGTLRVARIQNGVARVSCLDSLDRTNLTCSIFAKFIIPFQVQSISPDLPAVQVLPVTGVAPAEVRDPVASTRKALATALPILTNLWADSGDAISLLYAGTRALKADVTRTGQRQIVKGSFDDGLNSLTRYYLNNFSDGRKQEGYDLWSGKIQMEEIHKFVLSRGKTKAKQLKSPIFPRSGVIGQLMPSIIVDTVEPLIFETKKFVGDSERKKVSVLKAKGHVDSEGEPHSYPGFIVTILKLYSPLKITNYIDFLFAMLIFFYVFILVKIFRIKGQNVVTKSRLS